MDDEKRKALQELLKILCDCPEVAERITITIRPDKLKDCVFAEHYENTAGAVECKHPKYSFEYGIGYVFHPIVPGEHFCGYAEREGTE